MINFSDEFDVLANSYSAQYGIDDTSVLNFNEYEKSVFLTMAQEQVVQQLYRGDKTGSSESFESSEELRRYLANLVVTEVYPEPKDKYEWNNKVQSVQLYNKVLAIIYEKAHISNGQKCGEFTEVDVTPVTHDAFQRIKRNPFKGANSRRVLRLDIKDNTVELHSDREIKGYTVKYLKVPQPIILENLPTGLKINGSSNVSQDCDLHPMLQRLVLREAVKLALSTRVNNTN